jgi:hypothetical protein
MGCGCHDIAWETFPPCAMVATPVERDSVVNDGKGAAPN